MEYNSFYGGRRGASFVIVKKYATIAEMVQEFQKGGDYKTVNYDEYVLIDTINKNDKNNGKIYRRGYDYNNDMGGAIFVGQIVGPSGPAPHTLMTTIAEVDRITTEDGLVDDEGNTYRRSEGRYAPTENLLPGAKGTVDNRTFDNDTDSIQWAAVSVRDANSYESTVYVGFKFPYTIIDYTTQSVSTYNNGNYTDTSKAERIDDTTHPFYEKWRISIPKGVKGDTLKNFRMITADNSIQDYTGKADDVANERKILVYDYYHYDDKENGEPVSIYLGDYNMIEDVVLADDGTVTVSYTHDDDDVFTKAIKWIDTISVNGTTGVFTVNYNHATDAEGNPTQYTTTLRYVSGIEMDANGVITVKFTTGNDVVLNNQLNFILQTAIDNRYHLLVYYSDPAKRAAAAVKATWDGKNDWTDLGYIGNGTGVGAIAGQESDSGVSAVAATMPPYSAWLIVEEDEPASI